MNNIGNNISLSRTTLQHDRKKRDSNFELLRIIAMLLVLMVHAGFKALNAPSVEEVFDSPASSFLRFLNESISIICVNVFILITGWFGIRPRVSRICALIFQVMFIGIFIYICLIILRKVDAWKLSDWIRLLLFRRGLWFVSAYLVLYIFSPVLNTFATNASKDTFKKVLLSFFIIQTVCGFSSKWTFFCSGYSPLSFAGLYLLARYIKLFRSEFFNFNKWCDMAIYLSLTLFTTFASMIMVGYARSDGWLLYQYLSPAVIVSSVYFFLFFTKITFCSSFINWIASSAFTIYLFHCDPLVFERYYLAPIRKFYFNDSLPVFLIHTAILIIIFFSLSILIDKIRESVWHRLLNIYIQIAKKSKKSIQN